jgi:SAM-dependent methyltransferase
MYWFWITVSLILSAGIFAGVLWMIAGDLCGAPFVPSNRTFLEKIFAIAGFKTGKRFLDIGSGDGRAVRLAAKKYGLIATGIELQPFLIWYSRLISKSRKIANTRYIRRNFFHGKLPEAEYVYFYLFPGTVEKLGKKILAECNPGTIAISRAFEVKVLKKNLINTLTDKGRRVYFYRL